MKNYNGEDMIGDDGYGTWDSERLDKEYKILKEENRLLQKQLVGFVKKVKELEKEKLDKVKSHPLWLDGEAYCSYNGCPNWELGVCNYNGSEFLKPYNPNNFPSMCEPHKMKVLKQLSNNDYGESPNPDKVKVILEEAGAKWTPEGWIIESSLYLDDLKLIRLPLIKEVGGYFDCSNNQLTSLNGCPQEVGGNFYCGYNQLTSLNGCPQSVGGSFWCDNNQLTTLEGSPQKVGGYFDCSNNQLTSLKGSPQKVGGSFYCYDNRLKSLDGIGEVGGKIFSDFD